MVDIKQAQEIIAKATSGPWKRLRAAYDDCLLVENGEGEWLFEEEDQAFIAFSRTALPSAIEEIERLRAENATLKGLNLVRLLYDELEDDKRMVAFEDPSHVFALTAQCMVDLFKAAGGVNYVAWQLVDHRTEEQYELTMRARDGKTAAQKAGEAMRECDELKNRLACADFALDAFQTVLRKYPQDHGVRALIHYVDINPAFSELCSYNECYRMEGEE